jgi:hypothetical protein
MRWLLLVGAFVLAGCSTQSYNYTGQYCYTDQLIVKDGDESVSSKTIMQCTDRPGQQAMIQRAGIDASCREFWYDETRFGKLTKQRGVACEKFNGTLEILNVDGNVR